MLHVGILLAISLQVQDFIILASNLEELKLSDPPQRKIVLYKLNPMFIWLAVARLFPELNHRLRHS